MALAWGFTWPDGAQLTDDMPRKLCLTNPKISSSAMAPLKSVLHRDPYIAPRLINDSRDGTDDGGLIGIALVKKVVDGDR